MSQPPPMPKSRETGTTLTLILGTILMAGPAVAVAIGLMGFWKYLNEPRVGSLAPWFSEADAKGLSSGVLAMALGVVSFLVGLVLVILSMVTRRRRKHAARIAAMGYGKRS